MPLLVVLGLLVGLPAARGEDGDAWIHGTWVAASDDATLTLTLADAGRFTLHAVGAKGDLEQAGTWTYAETYAEGRLVLSPAAGDRSVYDVHRVAGHDDRFALTGDDLGTRRLEFRRAKAPTATPARRPVVYRGVLVGRWAHTDALLAHVLVFLPDGRYAWESGLAGAPPTTREHGTFAVGDGRITFTPEVGDADVRTFAVEDATLALALGERTIEFTKEAGSEATVVDEAAAADEAKTREDAAWRARLAVGPRPVDAVAVPAGDLPADPAPSRRFEAPRVFLAPQPYVRFGRVVYVVDATTGRLRVASGTPDAAQRPDRGTRRDRASWTFLPTGRVYVRQERYGTTLDPASPTVTETWGRYDLGEDDTARVETDEGEAVALRFLDGRRNLVFGQEVLGNVAWEHEALDRARTPR